MSAARIHYDGIDRRRLIAAILRRAKELGKRRPSQRMIAQALGISQSVVSYHMERMRQ